MAESKQPKTNRQQYRCEDGVDDHRENRIRAAFRADLKGFDGTNRMRTQA